MTLEQQHLPVVLLTVSEPSSVLQCPFMDERILSLHQKIKTQPLELPEESVSFSHRVTVLHSLARG